VGGEEIMGFTEIVVSSTDEKHITKEQILTLPLTESPIKIYIPNERVDATHSDSDNPSPLHISPVVIIDE
jgi:hypothetical protein